VLVVIINRSHRIVTLPAPSSTVPHTTGNNSAVLFSNHFFGPSLYNVLCLMNGFAPVPKQFAHQANTDTSTIVGRPVPISHRSPPSFAILSFAQAASTNPFKISSTSCSECRATPCPHNDCFALLRIYHGMPCRTPNGIFPNVSLYSTFQLRSLPNHVQTVAG